jgi:hypothetical protein
MNEVEQSDLLKALRPALKSYSKAETLLEKYWRDHRAVVWTTEQVHRAANERGRVLTNAEARKLLYEFVRHHNPQYGFKWRDLLEIIEQSVLGRKTPTGASDIAQEMASLSAGSKLAKLGMAQGWLKKEGRDYALV